MLYDSLFIQHDVRIFGVVVYRHVKLPTFGSLEWVAIELCACKPVDQFNDLR